MNIDKIITESINKIIEEVCEVYNAPNGWHSWEETDSANGLTPEEGKSMRMQPGNAARSQGTATTRDFGVVRGYKDWSENFKASGMDYPSYCKRFGLRR